MAPNVLRPYGRRRRSRSTQMRYRLRVASPFLFLTFAVIFVSGVVSMVEAQARDSWAMHEAAPLPSFGTDGR